MPSATFVSDISDQHNLRRTTSPRDLSSGSSNHACSHSSRQPDTSSFASCSSVLIPARRCFEIIGFHVVCFPRSVLQALCSKQFCDLGASLLGLTCSFGTSQRLRLFLWKHRLRAVGSWPGKHSRDSETLFLRLAVQQKDTNTNKSKSRSLKLCAVFVCDGRETNVSALGAEFATCLSVLSGIA